MRPPAPWHSSPGRLDQLRLRPVRRGRSRLRHDRAAQRRLPRLRQPDALASGDRARHRGAGQQHVCARGRAGGGVAVGAADGTRPAGQGTGSCTACAAPCSPAASRGRRRWRPVTRSTPCCLDWDDDGRRAHLHPQHRAGPAARAAPGGCRDAAGADRRVRRRPGRPAECDSPAHCRWWLTGDRRDRGGADQAGAAAAAAGAAAGHRRCRRRRAPACMRCWASSSAGWPTPRARLARGPADRGRLRRRRRAAAAAHRGRLGRAGRDRLLPGRERQHQRDRAPHRPDRAGCLHASSSR